MVYGDLKNLSRRTPRDKKLRDKSFNMAKNSNYYDDQRGLPSITYKFSNEKTSATRTNKFSCGPIKNEITSNQEFAEELHKYIIRIFEKRKVYSSFKRQYLGCWFSRYAVNK